MTAMKTSLQYLTDGIRNEPDAMGTFLLLLLCNLHYKTHKFCLRNIYLGKKMDVFDFSFLFLHRKHCSTVSNLITTELIAMEGGGVPHPLVHLCLVSGA